MILGVVEECIFFRVLVDINVNVNVVVGVEGEVGCARRIACVGSHCVMWVVRRSGTDVDSLLCHCRGGIDLEGQRIGNDNMICLS